MRGCCFGFEGSINGWLKDYKLSRDSFERSRWLAAWWSCSAQENREVALRKEDDLQTGFTSGRKWNPLIGTYSILDKVNEIQGSLVKPESCWTYYHIRPYEINKLINLEILSAKRHGRGRVPSKQRCFFHGDSGRNQRTEYNQARISLGVKPLRAPMRHVNSLHKRGTFEGDP